MSHLMAMHISHPIFRPKAHFVASGSPNVGPSLDCSSWRTTSSLNPCHRVKSRALPVRIQSARKETLELSQSQETPLAVRYGEWLRWAGIAALLLFVWRHPVPAGMDPRGLKVLTIFAATIGAEFNICSVHCVYIRHP